MGIPGRILPIKYRIVLLVRINKVEVYCKNIILGVVSFDRGLLQIFLNE